MTFNFNNSKNVFLRKKDKSNKGSLDERIVNLVNKINIKENYFTTSSCSGRIVLIIDEEKKMPGLFLFRSHKKISFNELKKELTKINNNKNLVNKIIYFKQEPCLLAVSCKDKNSQQKLFNLARNNGWKKSGILSLDKKFLIELISTENIAFPVSKNNKILVNDNFLKIVVKKANYNLERGWEKIERLERLIEMI